MIVKYYKSISFNYPELIDTTSSKKVVYLRKNIEIKQQEINNDIQTYYEYDEAKLTKEEYNQYLNKISTMDIQQQRADIDYIALMMGINLEEV